MRGSVQQRCYLIARLNDGASVAEAARFGEISEAEGRAIDAAHAVEPFGEDDRYVLSTWLRPWQAAGDAAVLSALCGPWGRA